MLTYNYPSGKILCKIYSTIQNVFEINIFTEQNMSLCVSTKLSSYISYNIV